MLEIKHVMAAALLFVIPGIALGDSCGETADGTGCKSSIDSILHSKMPSALGQGCHADASLILTAESSKKLKGLAKCPGGKGFRPLSSVHPAAAVVVGVTGSHDANYMISKLYSIARKLKPAPKLIVMAPLYKGAEYRHILEANLGASALDVTIVETEGQTMWAQDYMEPGVRGTQATPAVFELPYGRAPKAAHDLAQDCKYDLVSPFSSKKFEAGAPSGDFGGNIEMFPGDVLVVGSTTGRSVKSKLEEETGRVPLEVNTEWLSVGHADELFGVVPTNDPAPCNFAITHASPELGIKFLSEGTLSSKLLEANRYFEKDIRASLEQLTKAVSERSGCKAPKTIAMPVAFNAEKTYSETKPFEKAVAIDVNPVNSLVLGSTVVVPKPLNKQAEVEIETKLKAVGITPEFVHDMSAHDGHGEIHCSTNAIRVCDPSGQ